MPSRRPRDRQPDPAGGHHRRPAARRPRDRDGAAVGRGARRRRAHADDHHESARQEHLQSCHARGALGRSCALLVIGVRPAALRHPRRWHRPRSCLASEATTSMSSEPFREASCSMSCGAARRQTRRPRRRDSRGPTRRVGSAPERPDPSKRAGSTSVSTARPTADRRTAARSTSAPAAAAGGSSSPAAAGRSPASTRSRRACGAPASASARRARQEAALARRRHAAARGRGRLRLPAAARHRNLHVAHRDEAWRAIRGNALSGSGSPTLAAELFSTWRRSSSLSAERYMWAFRSSWRRAAPTGHPVLLEAPRPARCRRSGRAR